MHHSVSRVVFHIKASVMFVCNIYFLALAENADRVEDVTIRLPAELSMDVMLIHNCMTIFKFCIVLGGLSPIVTIT
jgi:hypothetical protein